MGCRPDKTERAVGEANRRAYLRREMQLAFLQGKVFGVMAELRKDFPEHSVLLKLVKRRLEEAIGKPPKHQG